MYCIFQLNYMKRMLQSVMFPPDYSNTRSDNTLGSNAKLGSGIPLAEIASSSTINQSNGCQILE